MTEAEALAYLGGAHRRGDITLYLGAGVSVGNGLPTWEQLVLSMYYSALAARTRRRADLV